MNKLIATLIDRQNAYLQALIEHIQLSLFSLLIAIFIAVPLAIFMTHRKKLAESLLHFTGICQTIPSLALLGLLIPFIGIGTFPAVIALVIYALFPILQNTYTGLTQIEPSLEEAADAFGMNKKEKLIKFELQLALPHMIAGMRTAAVLIIGTATLAALIGAGGLGTFILLGIDRNNFSLILIGAVSAALLAVVVNIGIFWLEKMRLKHIVAVFFTLLMLLGGSFFYTNSFSARNSLVIAGKLGAEPEILINMYKILIESHSDMQVILKPNFGKTSFLFNALTAGNIDIYPEYSGTVLENLLAENPRTLRDPEQVYEFAKTHILAQHQLVYLPPMQFQNTYALAVTRDFAQKHHLTAISDLHALSVPPTAGFTLEFIDRDDGYRGIQQHYGLTFSVKAMEPSLRYAAITQGNVDIVDAYSTDSEITQYDLVILTDDRHVFPPYQGAPLLRASTLNRFPALEPILGKLAGKITEAEMRHMNFRVNVNHEAPETVACDYLRQHHLIR